jgi:hypothetical protein
VQYVDNKLNSTTKLACSGKSYPVSLAGHPVHNVAFSLSLRPSIHNILYPLVPARLVRNPVAKLAETSIVDECSVNSMVSSCHLFWTSIQLARKRVTKNVVNYNKGDLSASRCTMFSRLIGFVCIISVALSFFSASVSANQVTEKIERAALTDSARAALQTKIFAIVKRSCAVSGCHTGKHPEARLLLDPAAMLKSTTNVPSREISSLMRVNTQEPQKSYLLMKIRGGAGIRGERMPRGGPYLKSEEIKTIQLWLESLSIPVNAKEKVDLTGKGNKSEPTRDKN